MLSERAFEKLKNRKTKVASYYLDATLFGDYWGWFDKRFYHHTGAVSTWCVTPSCCCGRRLQRTICLCSLGSACQSVRTTCRLIRMQRWIMCSRSARC